LQEIKVVKGLQDKWGTCSRTVSLDQTPVVLACWKDIVAVGLRSGDIITLDAITGTHASILSSHTDYVASLAFSSDGTYLVSGSEDKTVNLWDIQTGGVAKTFHSPPKSITSVSISPDHATIVLGCSVALYLLNVQTGEFYHTIHGRGRKISSVGFSQTNSHLFTTISGGEIIEHWDVSGHKIGFVRSDYLSSNVIFSLDGTCFLVCKEMIATLWNTASGVAIATFVGFPGWLQHYCFSPDGKLVAGSDSASTIYIWDTINESCYPIKTFAIHSDITSLTFSSSLISSSKDRLVRFWRVDTSSTGQVVTNSKLIPPVSAPITFVGLQAGDGTAVSCNSAGLLRGWDISTGLCKAAFHFSTQGLKWGDARLVNGRMIFVWYSHGKITIWCAGRGEPIQTTGAPIDCQTASLKLSGDTSKVFLLTHESIQAWSTWTGEVMGEVRFEGKPLFDSLIVDGSRVWVEFRNLQTEGWDFGTPGSNPIPLSTMPPAKPHLEFIHGTTEGSISPARVKDRVTGDVVFQLCGKYAEFTHSQWDGRYLVAGYKSGELLILDFEHMIPQ